MPNYGFGTTLSTVTTATGNTLTYSGSAFAENQFDGFVWVSLDGGTTKIYPLSYSSWGDTSIVAVFSALAAGTYTAGLNSGSDEASNILSNAFSISSGNIYSRYIGVGIYVGVGRGIL